MKHAKDLFDRWMEKNAQGVPAYNALYLTGKEQTIDATLFAAKSISGSVSFDDTFKTDDVLVNALTNVSGAMLPINQYFMLTHIQIMYAVAADVTVQAVKEANYNTQIPAEIINGELSISLNKKPIVDKLALVKFDAADNNVAVGDTNVAAGTAVTYTMQPRGRAGLYELECPKMLTPQELIEIKFKFAKAAAVNAAIKVVLHGVTNVTA